jgi:hypothetical protein
MDPPAFMWGTAALDIRYALKWRGGLLGDGKHGEDVTSESTLNVVKLFCQLR